MRHIRRGLRKARSLILIPLRGLAATAVIVTRLLDVVVTI
jgi:hypothetical protein